jgi:hypothetical protein
MTTVLRPLRQGALLFTLIIVVLAAGSHPVQAEIFDRVAAKERYRGWYRRFKADFTEFEKTSQAGPLDTARLNAIFAHSVAPDSRMTHLLLYFTSRPDTMRGSNGEPGAVSVAFIMVKTLEHALPAGFGGPYNNEKPVPGDAGSFVWYMHIHAGDEMADFFNNPKVFTPYRLPPYGVMERNVYPFVTFRDDGGKLYLSGLPAEFVKALNAIWQLQMN